MPDEKLIPVNRDIAFWYTGRIHSIYDGDTLRADIDVGLNVVVRFQKIRLARINAPELKGRSRGRGIRSRDALKEFLPVGSEVLLNTRRDSKGKFGRWLADIWVEKLGRWRNVNDWMIESGHAEAWAEEEKDDAET